MSFDKDHFRLFINRTLRRAEDFEPGIYSSAAVELLMLTCAAESDFGSRIYQVDGDNIPDNRGIGFFQMEKATERWLWAYMTQKRPRLIDAIVDICKVPMADPWALEGNLHYQVMMARVRYLPYPFPIPQVGLIDALANYHKLAYNTIAGKAKVFESSEKYKRYCL